MSKLADVVRPVCSVTTKVLVAKATEIVESTTELERPVRENADSDTGVRTSCQAGHQFSVRLRLP